MNPELKIFFSIMLGIGGLVILVLSLTLNHPIIAFVGSIVCLVGFVLVNWPEKLRQPLKQIFRL